MPRRSIAGQASARALHQLGAGPPRGRSRSNCARASKIGALEGLELGLALAYTLGSSNEAGQANLDLGAKYGLRDAGGGLPALALEADVSVPLGSGRGPDTELTLLAAPSRSPARARAGRRCT